jgi:hypothetical protein
MQRSINRRWTQINADENEFEVALSASIRVYLRFIPVG